MGAPGYDDAPMTVVPAATAPKHVTFIYPYYENPLFLRRQVEGWMKFPKELRRLLSVIVVDDGSPNTPAGEVLTRIPEFPFGVRLFRIEVDVRWNWLAARNIGMHHAPSGWCLLTDMDHVVTPWTANQLTSGAHDPKVIYRPSRCEADGTKIHPHPNSMFLTRDMFWKAGGYDEALSGHYGTDGDWRRRLAATAPVRTLHEELERHEFVADSSTVKYLRKQKEDAGKKPIIAARKRVPNWRPKVLSFPYHEVEL